MPRSLIILGAALGLGFVVFWASGGLDGFTVWAAAAQRDVVDGTSRT